MANKLIPEGSNESFGTSVKLEAEKDNKELSEDEKCYEVAYMPYGGATSFQEVETMQKAQEAMYQMDTMTDQLRGIIHNITMDDELDVDQKARAIQSAADDYRKRISTMSSKAIGSKSLMSRLFGDDKRRKKWPYHEDKKDEDEEEEDEKAKKPQSSKELDFDELPSKGGFKVYKDKEGNYRWLSMSSNAFIDLDNEIFTTEALKEAVEYADESGERGPLLVFHVPSAEIGQCDYQAVAGRFLIESGTFDDTPLGRKAVEYFANTDEEHQVSIGYLYQTGDEADGVYDWLRVVERSVLPKGDAANPWTDFKVIGGKEVDKRKMEALKSIFGEELSAQVINAAEERTKELEGKVRFKEVKVALDEEDKPQIRILFEDVPESEQKAEAEEETKSTEEETKAAPDEGMAAIAGVVSQLKDMVESLSNEVKELKKSDDEKMSALITPRALNGIRPTADSNNVIEDDKAKMITGEKDAPENPAKPYIMDLIGAREN